MRKGNNLRHGLRKFRRRYGSTWFQPSCFYGYEMACTCREVTRSGVTLFMPRLWHSCVNQTRRASTEVFPKLSSTFPDLQRSLALSFSPGDPTSLSTQEALSPVLGRGEDTAGPHQHGDTGGLCDGQLRVWNRSHLITWKRWPPTASKQTESLSPVAWPISWWKILLGCYEAPYFMGRSWFILVIQLGT